MFLLQMHLHYRPGFYYKSNSAVIRYTCICRQYCWFGAKRQVHRTLAWSFVSGMDFHPICYAAHAENWNSSVFSHW